MSYVRENPISESDNHDELIRGYEDIPDDRKLQSMSYIQLLAVLHSSKKDSPRFHAIEREIKKYLAKDQAKINRPNIILGALIGGIFGLSGVALGYYLKASQQIPYSCCVHESEKSNLSPKEPAIVKPHNNPLPIQKDGTPSKNIS